MPGPLETLQMAGYAVGAVGSVLLFLEFFQTPSYVSYDRNFNSFNVDVSPNEVDEFTAFGRVGAFLLSLAFAAEFFVALIG